MDVGDIRDNDSSVFSKQISVWFSDKKSRIRSVIWEIFSFLKHNILSRSPSFSVPYHYLAVL